MMDDQTPRVDFSRVYVLYGALRSGTTLFRLLLDHHPQISCPGERDFLVDHIDTATDRFDAAGLAEDWIFRESGLDIPTARSGTEAFAQMLEADLAQSKPILVLVIHRRLHRLLDLMPGCRFIHLVRDPRDVARSSIGMGWAGNTWYGIRHWLRTEQAWKQQSTRISAQQEHRLRYEDLITSPEAELQRICEFLGLQYDQAMMEYVDNSTYSVLDPTLTFQWRNKQSPAEISHVEYQVGSFLTDLGYEPSGYANTSPSAAKRMQLWLHNKTGIWRTRVRRYGLIDPLIIAISHRLGLRRVTQRAQARIDRTKAMRVK